MNKNYESLTYKELIELAKWDGNDPIELIALVYELDYDRAMEKADKMPINEMDWYFEEGGIWARLNKELRSKYLEVNGKRVRVPDDLKMQSFGKKLMINNLLKRIELSDRQEREIINLIPLAVAIYLVDGVEGEFRSESIHPLAEVLSNYPARIIYPIGMFFFRQLRSLTDTNQSDLRYKPSIARRVATRLKRWLKG